MTDSRSSGWRVERRTASATVLLGPWPADDEKDGPAVRIGRVTGRRALVLGSTQVRAVVDDERAEAGGTDVVRRTTGGGAVLVAPDAQVWLDLWVPRGDELWDDDIIVAARWLGATWREALERLGAGRLGVHDGPATRDAWSDLVCFAGLGPGEVHLTEAAGTAGAKVTGLAQRRTGAGARFHTSAPLVWEPGPLLRLLVPRPPATDDGGDDLDDDGAPGATPLAGAAVGLRALVTPWPADASDADVITTVEDAVIAALP